jgi:hypothetical protein
MMVLHHRLFLILIHYSYGISLFMENILWKRIWLKYDWVLFVYQVVKHTDDKPEHNVYYDLLVRHRVQVVNDVENYNHFSQLKWILFDPHNHINGILFDQSMNLLKTVEPLVDEEEQLTFELVSIFKNNNKGTKKIVYSLEYWPLLAL